MSDINTKTWRDFHPFPLTKTQQELLDHYNTRHAARLIRNAASDDEVIE